jgi:hypothetical protein
MSSRTRSQPGQSQPRTRPAGQSPARSLSARSRQPGGDPRLGSDRARRQLLSAIFKEVDAAPVGRCEGFAFPELEAPAPPSITVGDAINLADGIRIFEQYAKALSDACKHQDPITQPTGAFLSGTLLSPQLGWLEPLRATVRPNPSLEPAFDRLLQLIRETPAAPRGLAGGAAAELYALQQTLPHVDVEMVRHMLRAGRPSVHGYEAHVSSHLLRTRPGLSWMEHQEALDAWRDSGLLHLLLLAATHMPTLNNWLPVELHEQARGWGETLIALNGARSQEELSVGRAGGARRRLRLGRPGGSRHRGPPRPPRGRHARPVQRARTRQ